MAAADTSGTSKIRRYPCPGCSAELLFEPKDGCLTCPYCGRKEEIPASAGEVQERSYLDYLNLNPGQLQDDRNRCFGSPVQQLWSQCLLYAACCRGTM